MTRGISLIVAVLGVIAWAADDAAVGPQQGASIAPVIRETVNSTDADAVTIPKMLSYQGKLTDTLGIPVPDTTYQVTFRLYTLPTGGSPFWSETQTVRTRGGLFSVLLGASTNVDSVPQAGSLYLSMAVGGGAELSPRLRLVSAAYSFCADNAARLDGNNLAALDSRFVNEGQTNAVTSAMIGDGEVQTTDIANIAVTSAKIGNGEVTMPKINQSGATTGQVLKWNGSQWAPANDSAGGPPTGPAGGDLTGSYPNPTIASNAVTSAKIADGQVANVDLAANAVTGDKVQDGTVSSADIRDTTITTAKIKDGAVTSAKIADGTIVAVDLNQMGAANGQVLKWTGSVWAPRNDSVGGGGGDNAWVRGTPDSVLFTVRNLGIARGGADNMLHGTGRFTHTNLGVACTTGASGQNYSYCAVGGGFTNTAGQAYATVAGGCYNKAQGLGATVSGGLSNTADEQYATAGGGGYNWAQGEGATVAGGYADTAGGDFATVAGGCYNKASGIEATIGGGGSNTANDQRATVAGGGGNVASASDATVGGGFNNTASGSAAVVTGGAQNTASGTYATAAGYLNTAGAIGGGTLSGYRNLAGDALADSCAAIAGGSWNSAVAKYAFVGGGYADTANGDYAAIGGGLRNRASGSFSSVGGGQQNTSSGTAAVVAGGSYNIASGSFAAVAGFADTSRAIYGGALSGYSNLGGDAAADTGAVVAGGFQNSAVGTYAFVGGGNSNTASGVRATVGGGFGNVASGNGSAVGGGYGDTANGISAVVSGGNTNVTSGNFAAIGGGLSNRATSEGATVAGGSINLASGNYATVAGGYRDTAAGGYSFVTNNYSVVPSSYVNSAAFNGQVATASNQTRVGTLSKASGSFTIDHPLDPYGRILNHYFIEGPEMRNIYEGSVILDASGRAEVNLPDYFSALNRNPHIQLTGVGTSDVYVAEKVSGNRFVIGGRPGTEVYWQVTGERQDVSAEATRRMMPVEQPKSGELAGRMLDDEFLSGCMLQLEREGKTQGVDFRTAAGRERYESMKRAVVVPELER